MFEAMERAQQREAQRLSPEHFRPVRIESANDIHRVLQELDPARSQDGPEVVLSTTLKGEDEDGVSRTYAVTAPTRSRSKRSMLLDGFELLRRQQEARATFCERRRPVEVDGREMSPPELFAGDSTLYIDPLIRQWLGGQRVGMFIHWELSDGYTYRYSIFEHKLTRSVRQQQSGDAAAGQLSAD